MGSKERVGGGVPCTCRDVRPPIRIWIAVPIPHRLSRGLDDHRRVPCDGTLDRAAAEFELDQRGLLQAECCGECCVLRHCGRRSNF